MRSFPWGAISYMGGKRPLLVEVPRREPVGIPDTCGSECYGTLIKAGIGRESTEARGGGGGGEFEWRGFYF